MEDIGIERQAGPLWYSTGKVLGGAKLTNFNKRCLPVVVLVFFARCSSRFGIVFLTAIENPSKIFQFNLLLVRCLTQ